MQGQRAKRSVSTTKICKEHHINSISAFPTTSINTSFALKSSCLCTHKHNISPIVHHLCIFQLSREICSSSTPMFWWLILRKLPPHHYFLLLMLTTCIYKLLWIELVLFECYHAATSFRETNNRLMTHALVNPIRSFKKSSLKKALQVFQDGKKHSSYIHIHRCLFIQLQGGVWR